MPSVDYFPNEYVPLPEHICRVRDQKRTFLLRVAYVILYQLTGTRVRSDSQVVLCVRYFFEFEFFLLVPREFELCP